MCVLLKYGCWDDYKPKVSELEHHSWKSKRGIGVEENHRNGEAADPYRTRVLPKSVCWWWHQDACSTELVSAAVRCLFDLMCPVFPHLPAWVLQE